MKKLRSLSKIKTGALTKTSSILTLAYGSAFYFLHYLKDKCIKKQLPMGTQFIKMLSTTSITERGKES